MEEKIRAYRAFRERVLEDREADRIARNLEKEKQLQEYEDMQVIFICIYFHSTGFKGEGEFKRGKG